MSSLIDILHAIAYWIIRFFAKLIFHVFYRDHGALSSEKFPKDDGTPVLFVAAPHGNFLMDAITIFVTCPRNHYFLSAKSNFNYPIFGTIISLLGAIPVTRPQDVERINGDGFVKVLEDGKTVEGENIGKIVQVGDTLYVEFEGPGDNEVLKEACGTVEEILNQHRIRLKDPGMKWLTKGRRKGKLRRLVEYGSVVIRVERGNTYRTLQGLNLIPRAVSKSIDRLSTSPGRIAFPIFHQSDPSDTIQSPPNWLLANERTPLIATGNPSNSRANHSRQSSQSSTHSKMSSIIPPRFPRVPSIPTTYSYTHMPPHSEIYSAVYNIFSRSRCVAIFPEGISHDSEHMLSLKYGCAVMALGYLASKEPDAAGNKRTLKIVPCGVNFFNRHRFRSRVFVNVGSTIEVEERLIELYRQGGAGKRAACQELLKTIHSSLLDLTVNAPDYDTLLFFKTASRLFRDKLDHDLNFGEKLALLKRIAKKYLSTTPPTDEAHRLKRDIVSYAQILRAKRLSPPHMSTTPLSLLLYLPLFLFLFTAMIPGFILFSPIGFVARYVGKKQGENAMLYDDNSLAITRWPGRDVIATWKMLVATALFVTFDISYSVITVHYIRKFGLLDLHNSREVFFVGFLFFSVVWPLIAYGTILIWERMCWVGKRVWVGLWGVAKPRQRREFLSWREHLSQRVVKWVDGTSVAP
ncbi:hypothetical protein G9A89_002057 [Geosiphon pyriformis]|nr:hypothetical protein G9A89_002057 [Geosiphon pyriformis]